MSFDLGKLFIDWRRIVPNGIPNPNNDYHLVLLKEICLARGIDKDVVDNVILALEQDDKVKWKDKDGKDRETSLDTIKQYASDIKKGDSDKNKKLAVTAAGLDDKEKGGEEDKKEKEKQSIDFSTDTYSDSLSSEKDDDIDDNDTETQSQESLLNQDHETTDKQLNMTKQEAKAQAKSKDKKDVGAGTPESRAGEAMVHKGLRLLKDGKSIDEVENNFRDLVNQKDHILNSKEGKKWVDATLSTIKKLDEEIGIDNIENISWDTAQGREAIGVTVDLETSSDMFVRTKDGENIGISLKKDGNVFLNNGGWSKQSKKLVESLKGTMSEEDLQRLDDAMSLDNYNEDLLNRVSDATDVIGVEEIKQSFEKLKNEPKIPSVFGGASQERYFNILSEPEKLVEKIKSRELKGDDIKAYTKLLQVYHKEQYDDIRQIDNNLTKRAFDAINSSEGAKGGMKKHIVKSMHVSETLGLNERVKEGGVDKFITTYGIKPDGAILNEKTLITLLGSNFENTLNETIKEVRDGNASKEDLDEVIENAIEIDYDSGMILFKHENNKKYPLFYMAGRTRGIGSSPVMELAQTPLMAHALKEGTFNTDDWSEKGLERFKKDIKDIYE